MGTGWFGQVIYLVAMFQHPPIPVYLTLQVSQSPVSTSQSYCLKPGNGARMIRPRKYV